MVINWSKQAIELKNWSCQGPNWGNYSIDWVLVEQGETWGIRTVIFLKFPCKLRRRRISAIFPTLWNFSSSLKHFINPPTICKLITVKKAKQTSQDSFKTPSKIVQNINNDPWPQLEDNSLLDKPVNMKKGNESNKDDQQAWLEGPESNDFTSGLPLCNKTQIELSKPWL